MTGARSGRRRVDGRVGLRVGLRRVSSGLIAYGVVGLTIALIGSIALVWAGVRVGAVAARAGEQVASIVTTLDATSTALTDASASATSFALTLERTPPAVRQTAATVRDLHADLRSVEQQLGGVSILGSRPLGGVASVFGRMAANVEGLDGQLGLIADDLDGNRGALIANSRSLLAVGVRLSDAADDLRGGVVEDGLADVQALLTITLLLLVVWTAVPAAGALLLGWWLRRELGTRPAGVAD